MPALTDLQDRILRLFFDRRNEFFLTGGAALVGFYLHHRETHDLDLFTEAEALDEGERTLREIGESLDLEVETLRRSPDFRRFLLRGSSEGVVVDLAWVLSSFPIPTDPSSLYGMSQKDLEDFRESLVNRLTAAAFPRHRYDQ